MKIDGRMEGKRNVPTYHTGIKTLVCESCFGLKGSDCAAHPVD